MFFPLEKKKKKKKIKFKKIKKKKTEEKEKFEMISFLSTVMGSLLSRGLSAGRLWTHRIHDRSLDDEGPSRRAGGSDVDP